MTEPMNLGVDISPGAGQRRIARVYLDTACSYLKGRGAPTLTASCASLADFELEIVRLKHECDELLQRVRDEFGDQPARDETGSLSASTSAGVSESSGTLEASHPGRKTPLRIGDSSCVDDEMTRKVKTVRRNDKLSVVDELMKIGEFRHVVVVEDESDVVVGVVGHRDIFYGALAWSTGQGEAAHQKALDTIFVKNVMQTDVTTVSPDTSLADAARIMLKEKIGCLPVVRNERLVGILTEGDFLAMLTNAQYDKASR